MVLNLCLIIKYAGRIETSALVVDATNCFLNYVWSKNVGFTQSCFFGVCL